MSITVNVELLPFRVPNYVLTVSKPRPKKEGFRELTKYALAELDADTLAKLCDSFRADVFAKASKADPAIAT